MVPRIVAYALREFSRRKGDADSVGFKEFYEFVGDELLKNWGLEPVEGRPDVCADLAYLADLRLIRLEKGGAALSNRSGWWQAMAGSSATSYKDIDIHIINTAAFSKFVDYALSYMGFPEKSPDLKSVLRSQGASRQKLRVSH